MRDNHIVFGTLKTDPDPLPADPDDRSKLLTVLEEQCEREGMILQYNDESYWFYRPDGEERGNNTAHLRNVVWLFAHYFWWGIEWFLRDSIWVRSKRLRAWERTWS